MLDDLGGGEMGGLYVLGSGSVQVDLKPIFFNLLCTFLVKHDYKKKSSLFFFSIE